VWCETSLHTRNLSLWCQHISGPLIGHLPIIKPTPMAAPSKLSCLKKFHQDSQPPPGRPAHVPALVDQPVPFCAVD